MRDDFTQKIKDVIAARSGYRCSNPTCGKLTAKAHPVDVSASMSIGVAAHIKAASPGGPRYDVNQMPEERSSSENGIWLCQTCSRAIDTAPSAFTVSTLKAWKDYGESRAARESSASSDQILTLMHRIDEVHERMSHFIEKWQQNEPSMNFDDFNGSTDRMLKYSSSRHAAYHMELMPMVREVISNAEAIFGPNPLITEAETQAMMGPTNYISMRMLDEYLQKVKTYLTLR